MASTTGLSVRQIAMLLVAVSGTSGIGGAATTVWAQETRIATLEASAKILEAEMKSTREEVVANRVQMEGMETNAALRNAEVRGDIKDLRKLIIDTIKDQN